MTSIEELASRDCVPCKGTQPLSLQQARSYLVTVPEWKLLEGTIEREYRFKSYLAGLEFACAIGKLAEDQDHHPDILVGWRRVTLRFSTHIIKGLSGNDFIMAAKSELEFRKAISL